MDIQRDQNAIALVRLTTEFLKIEPLAFCFRTNLNSDSMLYAFDSAKYGVVVSLMLFEESGIISLDIAFSEFSDQVSDNVKPILAQFLQVFREIAEEFKKSVEFEIYCYGHKDLSVNADHIFYVLTT